MANTTIKITQLQNIGNGLATNTLLPVVNTTGTAITQKVTVGNVANFALSHAGNTLAPAFLANLAYSVVNAAQPNITSVGTLNVNTLKISGGTNGYVLQTDGAGNLSWAAGGGSGNGDVGGTNTQVQFNDAGDFGGNTGFTFDKTTGVLSASKINSANIFSLSGATINNSDLSHGATSGLTIPTNGSNSVPATIYNNYGQVVVTTGINPGNLVSWTFGNAGALQSPGGSFLTDDVEGTGDFGVSTEYNVGFVIKTSDNTQTWTFDTLGNLTLPGNTFAINYANGTRVPLSGSYGNSNVATFLASYGSNTITTTGNVSVGYIIGNGQALTGLTGANVSGFVPNANVANTAYAVAAANVSGLGNIATINLTASTSNVLYGNGVFAPVTSSAGTRLVNGDNSFELNVDGDVTFEGNVAGQGINRGLIWDYGANANGVDSTVVQNNGGLSVRAWTEQGGGANGYSAPVNIITNQDANTKQWRFDGEGNLTLPGNLNIPTGNIVSNIVTPAFNSAITSIVSTGNANVIITIASELFEGPASGQVTISGVNPPVQANDTWYYEAVEIDQFQLYTDANLTTPVDGSSWPGYVDGGTAVGIGAYGDLTVQCGNVSINSDDKTWTFDNTGNLTLPANTFAVNYANGTPVSISGGNTGNVTFDDNIVIGTGDEYGGDGLFLATGPNGAANLQYLRLRGGDFPTHIHLDTGNNAFYDQYFGNDNKFVKLEAGDAGNVVIGTDDTIGNLYNWTFTSDGNLNLPLNGNINANGGGITQVINKELNIVVQDEEDDGWSIFNTITDGLGNNLSQTQLDSGSFTIGTASGGNTYSWSFEGNTLQVSSDSQIRSFGSNVVLQSMSSGSGGTASLQSVSNTNDPNIFTTLDATTTGANITVYDGGSNGGVGYTWQFANDGRLTFPGTPRIDTSTNNFEVQAAEAINFEANTVVNIYTDSGNTAYQWQFGDDGKTTLPTISLGSGIDEQTVIGSQRKLIPPFRWSAVIDGTTPTVVYTASATTTTSMKIVMQVQHQNLGIEFFEISSTGTGINTYYSVNNRVGPVEITESDVLVDFDGDGFMQVTLTINSGALTSWVTYDSTEFGIPND